MTAVTILGNASNLHSICRLCLSCDNEMSNIFETSPISTDWTLSEKIQECLTIKVEEKDGLPTQICSDCCNFLVAFLTFKTKCITSDLTLRNYLQHLYPDFEVKSEDEEINAEEPENNDDYTENNDDYTENNDDTGTENSDDTENDGISNTQVILIKPVTCSSPAGSDWACQTVKVKVEINSPPKARAKSSTRKKVTRRTERMTYFQGYFPCSQCDKTFSHKNSLVRHEYSHSDDKLTCLFCNKTLSTRETLLRHVKAHNGDKPYRCTFCEKKYTSSTSFASHLRKHTGECPFQCPVCQKSFSLRTTLKRHFAKEHGKERSFRCDLCESAFYVYDDLRSHVNRVH